MQTPIRELYYDEEYDDCILLDGHNILHIGFRRTIIEINAEELSELISLLKDVLCSKDLWNTPEAGSVIVKIPAKSVSLLLLQAETLRLQHMLTTAYGELNNMQESALPLPTAAGTIPGQCHT